MLNMPILITGKHHSKHTKHHFITPTLTTLPFNLKPKHSRPISLNTSIVSSLSKYLAKTVILVGLKLCL